MEKNIFNFDSINKPEYVYIKNRIGEKVMLLLSNIKKSQKLDIYLFGSVIDFTFMKDISDTDCLIKYNNDNEKTKIIKFVSQQKDIKHINNLFFEITYSNKKYKYNVIKCEFDNGECIDLNIVNDDILSIKKKELSTKGMTIKIYYYILKVLYHKKKLIDKTTFSSLYTHNMIIKETLKALSPDYKNVCIRNETIM
jgi:predicted nucleotidyltransferase